MIIRMHRSGEQVKFTDDGKLVTGVCNGEAKSLDPMHPWVLTHLPVYVRDGDRCIMVAIDNIVEWNEE